MGPTKRPIFKTLCWLLSSLLIAAIVTVATVVFFAQIAPSANAQPYSPVEKLKLLTSASFLRVFVFRDYWLTIFPCLASFLIGAKIENARYQKASAT